MYATHFPKLRDPTNIPDYLVSPLNWTIIECALGIICISIPPMRPLFKKLAPSFLASYLTRNTAARTRTGRLSKAYGDGGSQPHAQHEIIESMNREMDRQLMGFELAEPQQHQRSESGESEMELVFGENEKSSTEKTGRGDESPV